MQQVLLHFLKKTDLANLKSDVDKLHIAELENLPSKLSNLKTKVDKLDIGKLETAPVDSSRLSNLVINDIIKKTEYDDELVKKFNAIQAPDN